MKRVLHPKLAAHGQKVKAGHAHLVANVPGFIKLPAPVRLKLVQAHIRGTK
jgi:hypothetical protein